jgi:P27 family predicted phage terminase small subunit
MPAPGPKPQPANLKILNGRSDGRDSGGRPVKIPPAFVRLAPEPPEFLTPEALAEWNRIVPELQRLEIVKTIDRAALASYCETWARFVSAQMDIRADGMYVTGSQGQPVKSPAVAIAEAASKELRAWCAEFGFTPSAEGNLNIGAPADGGDDGDPFAS